MHVETAAWTSTALAEIELPPGSRALDVGSSTLHYRTVEQPHIEQQVMAPLRARGVEIVHLDAKDGARGGRGLRPRHGRRAAGGPSRRARARARASVLQALRDPGRPPTSPSSALAPGGHLSPTTRESARRTYDPVDYGLRMSPDELAGMFERRGLERVRAESVRIDDPRYYRGLVSRPSWTPSRAAPGCRCRASASRPGARMPALRWRQSCVVMRRPLSGCAGDDRPVFLGIGAPKAGTTSLHEYMRTHPGALPARGEGAAVLHRRRRGFEEGWDAFAAVAFHGAPPAAAAARSRRTTWAARSPGSHARPESRRAS